MLHKVGFNFFSVGCWEIYFIDCDYNWTSRSFSMANSFDSLFIDTVVSSNDKNNYICDIRPSCPHLTKSRVSRCIDKRYKLAFFSLNYIRSYMLGYSNCLSRSNFFFSNYIKQRCFSMINMTHYSNYRWSWEKILLCVRRSSQTNFNIRFTYSFWYMTKFNY